MGNTTSCCVSSSPKLRRNAHSRLESYRPDTDLSREDTGCNLQHISDRENIDGEHGGPGAGTRTPPAARVSGAGTAHWRLSPGCLALSSLLWNLGARGPLGCPARERRGLSRSGLGYSGHRGAGGQVTGAGPCHQMGRGSAGQGRPRARCSRHGLVVVTTKLCITRLSSLVL